MELWTNLHPVELDPKGVDFVESGVLSTQYLRLPGLDGINHFDYGHPLSQEELATGKPYIVTNTKYSRR